MSGSSSCFSMSKHAWVFASTLVLLSLLLSSFWSMSAVMSSSSSSFLMSDGGGDEAVAPTGCVRGDVSAADNVASTSGTKSSNRVSKRMQKIFKFGRDPSRLLLEAAFQTKSDDSEDLLYSADEFALIQRSVYVTMGFFDVPLWSQAKQSQHLIGTASCLLALRRPAEEVALGALHAIYLKRWHEHILDQFGLVMPERPNRRKMRHHCDQRYALRQVLGSRMEQLLWFETGLGAHGPWHTCVELWQRLAEESAQNEKDNGAKNNTSIGTSDLETIRQYMSELPLAFHLCDEIDETAGGDMLLGGDWKRRPGSFFDTVTTIAVLSGFPDLAAQFQDAKDFRQALFPEAPSPFFMELTPSNHSFLFETCETSPEAHPQDLQRLEDIILKGTHDRKMLPAIINNFLSRPLENAVGITREWCDAVDRKDLDLLGYIEKMNHLKENLMWCERKDPRFAGEQEFPRHLPNAAAYPGAWEHDEQRLLQSFREHAGAAYWR